jgi:C-terminal processing protease CtpA/Prc
MAETAQALPVDALCALLRRHYVFADRVDAMCEALRSPVPAGLGGPAAAAWLSERLQSVAPDRHLRVRWFEQAPDDAADADAQASRFDAARADRFGAVRVECLDGGRIGLVEISEFYPAQWIAEAVAQAMQALAGVSALVFDLRRCRGGEPGGVACWASSLFGAQPVHLNDLYLRTEDRTESWWTRPELPGPRFVRQPVFVLVSAATFSAAEEFAYDLQALGRATIVGEQTRGGANPGSIHRLDSHFAVFVPDARAINPVTGDNWEGRGVVPDRPCAAAAALDLARHLAREATDR